MARPTTPACSSAQSRRALLSTACAAQTEGEEPAQSSDAVTRRSERCGTGGPGDDPGSLNRGARAYYDFDAEDAAQSCTVVAEMSRLVTRELDAIDFDDLLDGQVRPSLEELRALSAL